ncbi:MAG: acyl-CoA synthetase [Pseudomonadales bacterium]|nr:acyl-CoA synthetase [Pseudomonadales bacterium]
MKFNVADIFEGVVSNIPDREAVHCGNERLTYKELNERSNQISHSFLNQGIGKGDHIAIYGYNTVDWIATMLACYKINAVPININYRYVEEELKYIFDDADITGVVYQNQFSDLLNGIKDDLPMLKHFISMQDGEEANSVVNGSVDLQKLIKCGSIENVDVARSGDEHYVLYTGGTTGMPKGVVWRQEDVIMALGGGIDMYSQMAFKNAEDMANRCIADGAGVAKSFMMAPLMHGAAQWGLIRAFFEGFSCVLSDKKKFDAASIWQTIEDEKVNILVITGDAMAKPLMDELKKGDYDTSSVFVVASSAAIFSPGLKDQYKEMMPDLLILDNVGSSEGGFNGVMVHEKGATTKDEGGPRIQPGKDVVVLDVDNNILEFGSGEQGYIARGGNIPIEYYKDPVKTAKTFITASDGNRYVIAGDMARCNPDGTITLLGRGSNCINSGGEKIFPEEVEGAVKNHDKIYDCLVVPTPDERFGSCVTAVISLMEGVEEPSMEEIHDACSKTIGRYKLPRRIYVAEEVKRAPSGKPDYKWAKQFALDSM